MRLNRCGGDRRRVPSRWCPGRPPSCQATGGRRKTYWRSCVQPERRSVARPGRLTCRVDRRRHPTGCSAVRRPGGRPPYANGRHRGLVAVPSNL